MESAQRGEMLTFVGPDGIPFICTSSADPAVKQSVKIAAKFVTAARLKLLFAIPEAMLVLTREGMHAASDLPC